MRRKECWGNESHSHSSSVRFKGHFIEFSKSFIMFVAEVFQISFLIVFPFFVAKPLYDYFRDVKGFRRYPAAHPIAGINNLWYM
jgi:hypothetical protein